MAAQLIGQHAEVLTRKAISQAFQGDSMMLRFLLERLLPRPNQPPVQTVSPQTPASIQDLPNLSSLTDPEYLVLEKLVLKAYQNPNTGTTVVSAWSPEHDADVPTTSVTPEAPPSAPLSEEIELHSAGESEDNSIHQDCDGEGEETA
jgi:hypothetical protein